MNGPNAHEERLAPRVTSVGRCLFLLSPRSLEISNDYLTFKLGIAFHVINFSSRVPAELPPSHANVLRAL